MKVTKVTSLFIECFGKAVFEGSFPDFNFICKENNAHLPLLMNMFGKPEMWAKGNCFDSQVKPLKGG